MCNDNMPIITIDGNIGSCKTSVLNYFHKHYKIAVDLEPVENWTPYLNKLYENTDETSYNFQVRVWTDRCWIQEKSENTLILMERSPYFIKNVFIEKALEDSTITAEEYDILQMLHSKTEKLWSPHAYIYLKSDPAICMHRIQKRCRPCEKSISQSYIVRIDSLHKQKLEELQKSNINVIVIDIESKSISEICTEIINNPIFRNIVSTTDSRHILLA